MLNLMRQYIINKVFRLVNILYSFTTIENIPNSYKVRIKGGKVRYVHTITLSSTPK